MRERPREGNRLAVLLAPRRLLELSSFLGVGAAVTVLDIALFNLVHFAWHVGPLSSKAVSVSIATLVSFELNRRLTWRSRPRSQVTGQLLRFLLLAAVGLVLTELPLAVSHYLLGLQSGLADNIAGNVVGQAIGTVFRFWAFSRWVFPADTPGGTESDIVLSSV